MVLLKYCAVKLLWKKLCALPRNNMDYVFRQHYTMKAPSEQAQVDVPVVLLLETEPEALALYGSHLTKAKLLVNICFELTDLLNQVATLEPHLLIVNPSRDLNLALAVLHRVAEIKPGLPIIT